MRASRFAAALLCACPALACDGGDGAREQDAPMGGTSNQPETPPTGSATGGSAATSSGQPAGGQPSEGAAGGAAGLTAGPDPSAGGAAGAAPAAGGGGDPAQLADGGESFAAGGAGKGGSLGETPDAGSGGTSAPTDAEPDAGSPTSGTPTEAALAELPAVRQEHSVVALDGEVYVIGGYAPNVSDSVLAYHPPSDSWRDVAPFPEAMNHGNAAAVNGKIHVAGYYVGGMTQAAGTHYAYDPQTDAWTSVAPLPLGTERAASCVAADGASFYLIGGAASGMSVELASRYDATLDSWEILPPLPERREHCTAGVIDGIVYVAGGRADGIAGVLPTTWAFDPEQMQWAERAPLSPARGGLAGAVLGGHLFVFGGEGNSQVQSGVFPDVDAYDPVADAWEKLLPMDVPRHGFGAATLDARIYLAGGATRQGGGADDQSSVFYFE